MRSPCHHRSSGLVLPQPCWSRPASALQRLVLPTLPPGHRSCLTIGHSQTPSTPDLPRTPPCSGSMEVDPDPAVAQSVPDRLPRNRVPLDDHPPCASSGTAFPIWRVRLDGWSTSPVTTSTAFRARAAGDDLAIIHVVDELAARGVGATGLPAPSRLLDESNGDRRVQTARDGALIEVVAKRWAMLQSG